MSLAIATKQALSENDTAVLSTHSKRHPGFPFGSITPYDLDAESNVIIYISRLAEHWKNLQTDPRASLLIFDRFGFHDPQAHSRLCVLLTFAPITAAALANVQQRYRERFPQTAQYEQTHDFEFFRGEISAARWIQGFGSMGWVDGEQIKTAEVEPIAYYTPRIIQHMNLDHRDALLDLALSRISFDERKMQVEMVNIQQHAMTIRVMNEQQEERLQFEFAQPIQSAEEARKEIIALLKTARIKVASEQVG